MSFPLIPICVVITALSAYAKPLEFSRVNEVTYAIHTRYSVDDVDRPQRRAYLYRLEFQKRITEASIEADLYHLKRLSLESNTTEYSSGVSVGYDERGQLPLLLDAYNAGNITGILSPEVIFKKPLLFPALGNVPENLSDGTEWHVSVSPFILEESIAMELLRGEKDHWALVPIVMQNKIVGKVMMNGQECTILESHLSVESKNGGWAKYQVKSFFDHIHGVPIINIIQGQGEIMNLKGQLKPFDFYRKEVMVSVVFPEESEKLKGSP